MKFNELLGKYWEDQKEYWKRLKGQREIHGLTRDFSELYDEVHREARPIFVLSTGRCGTKLLTNILKHDKTVDPVHEPAPELSYHSSLAYKNPTGDQSLEGAIDMARYELLRDTYLLGKRYVETNNRITFFAYYLAELFPKAQFLHLVRHPDDFISSGLARKWYSGKTLYDEGRIRAIADFESLDKTQKIAWLWLATNKFALEFKEAHPDRCALLKAEDLFEGNKKVHDVLHFLGIDSISPAVVAKETKVKVNKGRGINKDGITVRNLHHFEELKTALGY